MDQGQNPEDYLSPQNDVRSERRDFVTATGIKHQEFPNIFWKMSLDPHIATTRVIALGFVGCC
jgi:hypothetical protein